MTLSPENFSLLFHPALASDTAEYICLVNDRHSPEAIIDLLVQGKFSFNALVFVVFGIVWHTPRKISYGTRRIHYLWCVNANGKEVSRTVY